MHNPPLETAIGPTSSRHIDLWYIFHRALSRFSGEDLRAQAVGRLPLRTPPPRDDSFAHSYSYSYSSLPLEFEYEYRGAEYEYELMRGGLNDLGRKLQDVKLSIG